MSDLERHSAGVRSEVLFGLTLLSTVFILLLPLPPWALDVLLGISVALSVLILLGIAYVRQPMDLHAFPTVLLLVTLFRLGLNVATTRAILAGGDAGELIRAFGSFVVQGNYIVGLIVFGILTVINFIVITKGAGRVAEVSARFTLDAMPGKQMSIDADLNAGLISEAEARDRRRRLEQEAGFYGSMDGASKFVRGDAVAGLLITAVNLIGGFAVGMLQMGLDAQESLRRYTLLSIGDGLVSQIPSLLISTAAGILVTRSAVTSRLDREVATQVLGSRRGLQLTAGILAALGFLPGFPTLALFCIGGVLFLLSRRVAAAAQPDTEVPARAPRPSAGPPAAEAAAARETVPPIEPFALEFGLDLLPLAQGNLQNLLDRISLVRRNLSRELGLVLPPISVRDNSMQPPKSYRFLLRGHELASGEVFPGQYLAMGAGPVHRPLRGRPTVEPAFGLPAVWIFEQDRLEAERLGYAVVDPLSVVITHLSECIKANAAELLTRQDTQKLLDGLKESNGAVLQEMAAFQVTTGLVHRVLQGLLREGISVRDLPTILERMCDHAPISRHVDDLVEACRRGLAIEITQACEIDGGRLRAITVHPELEQQIGRSVRQTAQETQLIPEPALARHVHEQLRLAVEECSRRGIPPVVLCAPQIRLAMRRFFGDAFPSLRFVAYHELLPRVGLESVRVLTPLPEPVTAAST